MSEVELSPKQQKALARYIDKHGFDYGNDSMYINQIRKMLPPDPGHEESVQD